MLTSFRTAKNKKEEELAKKASGGTSSRIIVPGTPRHAGIGAGARVSQTPRRLGGI
jgi:pre-mRNA-splicing factor ATP-dependent RNA helicase DHX38/PRP16